MSEMALTVKVLFFASLKDRVGVKQVEINLPAAKSATVADLRQHLVQQFPGVSDVLQVCPVAVNRRFAFDQDPIPSGAEVAFFPRASGG